MTDLIAKLRDRNVPFDVIDYADELFTAEAVARAADLPARLVAKAMLVRLAGGDHRIVVVPGDRRVDLAALGKLFGGSVRLVDRRQVPAITGVPVGAITPLVALARPQIAVIMDEALLSEHAINISSGLLRRGVNVAPLDLKTAVGATVAGISS